MDTEDGFMKDLLSKYRRITDKDKIDNIVKKVLDDNKETTGKINENSREKIIGYLVGKVIKESGCRIEGRDAKESIERCLL